MVTASDVMPARMDLVFALGSAAAGTAGLVLLFKEPLPAVIFMVLLLALCVARWHTRADLAALAVGLTLGNATELLCDSRGLWIHFNRSVLGVAPAYILVCYAILWVCFPRLMDALLQRQRPPVQGVATALLLWGGHVGLAWVVGSQNTPLLLLSAAFLAVTLWRFHDAHDLGAAGFGALLGMVWEIPATLSGAWIYPEPQFLGLIPWWLPVAYGVFFVNLARVTAWLATRGQS